MRILLVNSTCKLGGVIGVMLSLKPSLERLGHECGLFFFEHGTADSILPHDSGAHFGTLADCMRLVEAQRIEVVHANNVDWPTGIAAVRELGARLVVTSHKVRDHNLTFGWTTASCDAFTAVSGSVRDALQPFTDVKIQVVQNGIDAHAFHPAEIATTGPPIAAWVGRGGSLIKRIDRFAEIAPALSRAGIRVWVVDQHGPERVAELLPEAASTLREVAERWGGVPFAQMPEVYRQVAASGGCIVSTSRAEGLSLALLEAQACGCAAIGPDVRGVNESIFPQHGGILYPADIRAPQLADLVIDTLRNRDALRARQREAAEYIREEFSRDRMAERYVRVYQEAPGRARQGVVANLRGRLRHSPLFHWGAYRAHRWSVGYEQYATAQELARRGEWYLAGRAARASVRMSPTIYMRPRRAAQLVRLLLRRARTPLALGAVAGR